MNEVELERRLGDLLSEAAAGYPVPADAPARLREMLAGAAEDVAPGGRTVVRRRGPAGLSGHRLRPGARVLAPAAALVVLCAGVLAIGLTRGGPSGGSAALHSGAHAGASAGYLSVGRGSAPAKAAVPAAGGGPAARSALPAPLAGPKVVKTGSVVLQSARGRVGGVLAQVSSVAAGLGGYVASSNAAQVGPSPFGTVTLRVPAGRFDAAVTQVRRLGRVLSVVTSGEDVTGQYVDLGSQIAALQVSRQTYLTIEAKATTIGQVLAVQQQIDQVQQQLQTLEGQRKLLADQAAMSQLTVTVQTAATVAPPPPSGLTHAFHTAANGFLQGLEVLIAASGPVALVLICLAVVGLVARLGWRRLRRRLV